MLWSSEILEVNPHCKVTVEHVGQGKHKVLLADNFYKHPDRLAEMALNLYYSDALAMTGNYPGARALVTLETGPLIQTLGKLWGEPLEPYHSNYHPVIFSAIINKEYRLNVWQRQPHIDQGVTAMMYLNPPEFCAGGTGLFRHRPTGLERLPITPTPALLRLAEQYGTSPDAMKTADDYAQFQNTLIFNPLFAVKDNTYINDGNDFWELLYLIEMRSNRLVIFDGRMPHSQHIKPDQFKEHYRINQVLYFKGHD